MLGCDHGPKGERKLEMSYRKELHKARLMAQGLPEWQAEMVAAEAEAGGMAGAISDARIHAGVHTRTGVIPEREPTAQERAWVEERDRARRAQEAEWEAARARSAALQDEWNKKR
jgi:hypothetical protein